MGSETSKDDEKGYYNSIEYLQDHPWEVTPSEEVFKEIIDAAIVTWGTFSDEFGYRSEKIARVQAITNHKDNVMAALRMFHPILRREVISVLSPEAQKYVKFQGE